MRLLWLFEFGPVPRLHWAAFQRPVVFVFLLLSLLGWNRWKWVLGYIGWIWAGEGEEKERQCLFWLLFGQLFWVWTSEVEEDISPGTGTGKDMRMERWTR